MTTTCDVVVLGGGIGGAASATVLARAGLRVHVIEPTLEFPDIVRGEWLAPWGGGHAKELGLYDILVGAGGHTIARHVSYDEAVEPATAEAESLVFGDLLPHLPGPLAVRHPVACQALLDAAADAGAVVHRGASGIVLADDRTVTATVDGQSLSMTARIVIGADGRSSAVRRSLGIELERYESAHFLAGVLVEGLGFLGDDQVEYVATEKRVHALCFPQGGGRARLYLAYGNAEKDRFAGGSIERGAAYLGAFAMECWPGSEAFAAADVIGPAKAYRSVDTWCEHPFADGVVLIGDAAGHNDPIIGQGLSITMADVLGVTRALLGTDDWTGADLFEPYATERLERLRRLRATAQVYALATGGQSWAGDPDARRVLRNDPVAGTVRAAAIVGPGVLPEELFTQESIDRMLAPSPA